MEWNGPHENALKNNKFGIFATKQTVRTMHLLDGFLWGQIDRVREKRIKRKTFKKK